MILDNIKRLCRERGMNISELERAVGIGVGSIYKWGKSSPSVNAAKLVADFFGTTVDKLLSDQATLDVGQPGNGCALVGEKDGGEANHANTADP